MIKALATLTCLTFLTACSGVYKSRLDFDPKEPIRVAVLPFVSKDSSGKIVQEEGRLFVDNIGLISSEVKETPAQLVRKFVLTELNKSNLDLVSTALIDIDLPHHGYANPDGSLDIQKVWEVSPASLCASFLSCDAVLYGIINNWDRSYYGLESVNSVGIDLSIVSAKSGKILFSAKAEDSEGRGLSKIPTGISSVFIEPLKGLDSEIISELAQSMVKKILKPLVADVRPEFVDSSPPAIFASSHNGLEGRFSPQKPLVIVMMGSENSQATFSIGDTIKNIPMIESAPGRYYGEFIPLATDNFQNQKVTVALTDKYSRTSVSEVPTITVSYP